MLDRLPPRERQIVDLLYVSGPATVADIVGALPVALSASAVRAMLTRLAAKGYVVRSEGAGGIVFRPAVPEAKAKASALRQVVQTFFGGSPASAATALLGMSDRIEATELDALERLIAEARAEQGK